MILNRGTPMSPLPLTEAAAAGGIYSVDSVRGPEQQRLRLCEMGVVAGAPVSVVACSRDGMLVVKVGGSRMALSRGMSESIFVHKALGK